MGDVEGSDYYLIRLIQEFSWKDWKIVLNLA
jgi:hypothetical protein